MRKLITSSFAVLLCILITVAAVAQSVVIKGKVTETGTGNPVPSVSVMVKGGNVGTYTDENGNFSISLSSQPPVVLVFTSIGYISKEVTVDAATDNLSVSLEPGTSLGDEVVVSASRVAERILESPVSVERMGIQGIRRSAAPNYYEGIANMKGTDMTTSSLSFRTISTRGFNGSGNLRFNQLIDGMDNQAPGLNFSVGSVVGPTELDIDNVELLQGASSALYGPGGMNGTLLITSKDPFKYEGLSFQIKQGINHIDGKQRKPAPYYDWSLRWAKKINEKFAFKISGQLISAKDWHASDTRNLARNNVFSELKPGDRNSDPNYDGVNVFGDEVSATMQSIAQVFQAQTRQGILDATNGTVDIISMMNSFLPAQPTQTDIATFLGMLPAELRPSVTNLLPFYLGMRNNVFGSQVVSRTGYNESDLVDYDTYNIRVNGGVYYKFNDRLEASLSGYIGTGTTVYTGADRYSLKNLIMGQYKLELKSTNWFFRAYTTQENSGDSYASTIAAVGVNRAWKSDADWLGQYTGAYSGAILQGATPEQAHAAARAFADQGRLLPGTDAFNAAFKNVTSVPISQGGAKFDDKTDLYHFEGQYNLSDKIKVVDVLVGANCRIFDLNSNGTIFADTTGTIKIKEYGAYMQLQKKLFNEVVKLTGSIRYDKNENFKGRFTPRATALIKVADDNNIRLSFQTAYRFPSAQDQYINLQTPGSRLIGGLPQFYTFFGFNNNPAYTAESVAAYRQSIANGTPNPNLLQQAQFKTVKPETVSSYEIGYRGLVTRKFLVDAYVYMSRYNDFIAREAVARGNSGNPANAAVDLASPFTSSNYSFVTNTSNTVKAYGWGISADYLFNKGYQFTVNISSDKLTDVDPGLVTFFNTPELRYNIGLSNDRVFGNWGFNILYRWQDKVLWQGTFGSGEIPSFGTLDAQISYKIQDIRSMVKIGATNLLNNYYNSAFGNPSVGGLYYISFGYNIF